MRLMLGTRVTAGGNSLGGLQGFRVATGAGIRASAVERQVDALLVRGLPFFSRQLAVPFERLSSVGKRAIVASLTPIEIQSARMAGVVRRSYHLLYGRRTTILVHRASWWLAGLEVDTDGVIEGLVARQTIRPGSLVTIPASRVIEWRLALVAADVTPETFGRAVARSDSELAGAVHRAVWLDSVAKYDCDRIDVGVRDGFVTLRGAVRSAPMRQRAEFIARHVPGVRDVRNELKVGERSTSSAA